MKIKTFKDLKFGRTNLGVPGTDRRQAVMFFENGYGISVIQGYGAHGNESYPYECACLIKDKSGRGFLLTDTFSEEWFDSVKGWCNEQDVTDIMKQIQNLTQ